MTVMIFLGPSLPVETARELLIAEYHPPAKRGAVLHALEKKPEAIGIVDGRIDCPVSHKEILVALDRGTRIFGAGGMGALLAADLHHFGMVGVGEIFTSYNAGALEDDDEVIMAFGDASLDTLPSPQAMVDIRDACLAAEANGYISSEVAARVIATGKAQHPRYRHFSLIFEILARKNVSQECIEPFRQFLAQYKPSLTERDAITMLHRISKLGEPASKSQSQLSALERTTFIEDLESEVRLLEAARIHEIPADIDEPLRSGQSLRVLRKKVLLQILAAREAKRLGISVTSHDWHSTMVNFRCAFGLESEEELREWLRSESISSDHFIDLMYRFSLVDKVERYYGRDINCALPEMLRFDSARSRTISPSSETGESES